ncbi:transcriptional repressor brinker [Leptinotarsa decemlineata]|uniref:transcriptional repressor brinker n=1 Tax=Leptinotarsa decemlineata TaxID=7539 RepID=UPI003D30C801
MAHGLNSVLKRGVASVNCKSESKGVGSRRIFAPHFKLQVLDSYRNDADCKGNQRATARKYGIHRRQIQKWLQVENTLRNAVIGAKEKSECERKACDLEVTLNVNRQRDDEARVPALTQSPAAVQFASPLPLDFTTHSRGHASPIVARPESPLSPPVPMDLSFKRPTSLPASAPVCYAPLPPPAAPSPPRPQPDVWDLSTKSFKRECPSPVTSPKPVKLFKPYLDDLKEPELTKLEPPCCSLVQTPCDAFCYDNNNDVKSEYGGSYTLHELQPNSPVNYYYYPPFAAEYDCGTCCFEEACGGQGLAPLRQRQRYSLDFKLSAIDCYYQDSVCKGNQRAVASKYNIHRRQIQKWLKQAEELRMRNETVKQTHAVR